MNQTIFVLLMGFGLFASGIEICQKPEPWQAKVLRCYYAEKDMLKKGFWCDPPMADQAPDIDSSTCVLDGKTTQVRCDYGKKMLDKEVAVKLQKSLDEKYQDRIKCGATDDLTAALKTQAENTVAVRDPSSKPLTLPSGTGYSDPSPTPANPPMFRQPPAAPIAVPAKPSEPPSGLQPVIPH